MAVAAQDGSQPGILAPLRRAGVFRTFWAASLVSNLGSLIQGVGAAWLMTSLAGRADLVALIQTAALLPALIFALPAGALADMFDRRSVLVGAQLFSTAAAFALAALAYLGHVDAVVLLVFTFAVGTGNALSAPAAQASVREMVAGPDLAAALLLTAISFNIARALGPALGGVLVAGFGAQSAFLVNALSTLVLIAALFVWRRELAPDDLPRERFTNAIIAGLRYVKETQGIRIVLVRGTVFGFLASSVLALLPLVARDVLGGGASLYGILLGAFGIGALGGAFIVHPLRQRHGAEAVVLMLSGLFGAALLVIAFAPSIILISLALAAAGAAWLGSWATFNIGVQTVTAPWVQARVVAIYQMLTSGAMAIGSWVWGTAAHEIGLGQAQATAGVLLLLSLVLHRTLPMPAGEVPDLRPMDGLHEDPTPEVEFGFDEGPVLVLIEYRVPLPNTGFFARAIEDVGHQRKRDGAQRWNLFQDTADAEHWFETFTVASWFEYLRQRRRATAADEAAFARARVLLDPAFTPVVRRMIHRHSHPLPRRPVSYPTRMATKRSLT